MNKQINLEFMKYVALNMFGQIAFSCYTMADTYFVSSKLGADGLTALNLAFPIFCLLSGIGLMMGIGGGTRYTICKNRQKYHIGNQIFTNTFILALAISILFVFIGLFYSEKIVVLLGANQQVFHITNTYLKVMLIFSPAFIINNLLHGFIRNDGNPSLSMYAMLTGSFSNIILDYTFIFHFNMGILGAIVATGLAPIISMLVLSLYFIKRQNCFHFTSLYLNFHLLAKVISNGIPPFLTELTSGLVMLLFNFILLKIEGNIAVAAFSIITVISLVIIAIYSGLSQGIQPLISKYHGLNKPQYIKQLLNSAMITSLILSILIYAFINTNSQLLASAFNHEQNVLLQKYAVDGLKLYFTACPFIGFNIVLATYFISIDKALPAQIITILRGFIILIPTAFILSVLFKINGVFCAYPTTEFIVMIIGITLYLKFIYQKKIAI